MHNGYRAVHKGCPAVHNGYPRLTWVGAETLACLKRKKETYGSKLVLHVLLFLLQDPLDASLFIIPNISVLNLTIQ